jgi:hypothetical protein
MGSATPALAAGAPVAGSGTPAGMVICEGAAAVMSGLRT